MTLEMDKVQNIATLNNICIWIFWRQKRLVKRNSIIGSMRLGGGYLDFHSIYHTVWIYEYIQNMNPV